MQLKDKVFLVTGGGSGLGAATATALIEAGAKVVLADVNRAAGEKLAAELGGNALFVETDVTGEASAANAINATVTGFCNYLLSETSNGTASAGASINFSGNQPADPSHAALQHPAGVH